MFDAWLERRFSQVLAAAGIALNGPHPWDIRVRNTALFRRAALSGAVGLGDAYVDHWWDCDALDQLFDRALRADLPAALRYSWPVLRANISERLFNHQARGRIVPMVRGHYDRGAELFMAMLDSRMVYSCALWDDATTLEEAQEAKLDLICRKLGLRPGMTLLDIGCGWGGLARLAAERYGARVVGLTLSQDQASIAAERCRRLPVQIRIQDYRDLRERFDRIASIGMFEHVGQKNYRAFMRVVAASLAPDGLALLHFFGTQRSWPNTLDSEVLWIQRRIFPGMVAPSLAQVGAALDGLLVCEDVQNIGVHYDDTLMAWYSNFHRAWPMLQAQYGERFYRLWKYYLLSCAGAFRSRKYQVWQFVLSKGAGAFRRLPARTAERPVPGRYESLQPSPPALAPATPAAARS